MHQTYQNHKRAILYKKINIFEGGIESCGPRDGERPEEEEVGAQ